MNLYNRLVNLVFSKPKYYKIITGPAKGTYLYMPLQAGIRMYLGVWEKRIVDFMENTIHEGDYCLDLGSHVGYFTVLLAKLAGKRGKVLAFEPIKRGFYFQQRTMEKNDLSNVTLLNFALGDKHENQKGYVFSDSGMVHFDRSILGLDEDHKSEVFEIKTLDEVPEVEGIKKIDFIKIDIEGFEYRALRGGYKTIQKHKPNMLIEIHNRENYKGVYDLLRELGYSFYDLDMREVDLSTDFNKKVFHIYAKAR